MSAGFFTNYERPAQLKHVPHLEELDEDDPKSGDGPGLYFITHFRHRRWQVVYVGSSTGIRFRLQAHSRMKPWRVFFVLVSEPFELRALHAVERVWIRRTAPTFNRGFGRASLSGNWHVKAWKNPRATVEQLSKRLWRQRGSGR